ncbi:MAG: HU family DNA-binding protein [Succinivibrionaceae bacterium]
MFDNERRVIRYTDTITKCVLVDYLMSNRKFKERDAKKLVDEFFETLMFGLEKDGQVNFRSLGDFVVKKTVERVGRNPKTGVEYNISSRKVVKFKASKTLRSLMAIV